MEKSKNDDLRKTEFGDGLLSENSGHLLYKEILKLCRQPLHN